MLDFNKGIHYKSLTKLEENCIFSRLKKKKTNLTNTSNPPKQTMFRRHTFLIYFLNHLDVI